MGRCLIESLAMASCEVICLSYSPSFMNSLVGVYNNWRIQHIILATNEGTKPPKYLLVMHLPFTKK